MTIAQWSQNHHLLPAAASRLLSTTPLNKFLHDLTLRGRPAEYLTVAYFQARGIPAEINEATEEDREALANLRYANLRSADLSSANLSSANLSSANLSSADLSYANLRYAKNMPQSYINLCSRDILFVFQALKKELPAFRKKLVAGEINGNQYEGECACLIGTMGNVDGGVDSVCARIPFYEKGLENYCEQWFWNIREGDTPEKSFFAKHALELLDSVLKPKKQ